MKAKNLQSIFWKAQDSRFQNILTVLLATCLLAISAQISIPLQPVPLTFQSATVILIGLSLGARLGAATVLTYLSMGALGAPIFANLSCGFPILLGPTGGYLLGFLPAAMLAGFLSENGFAKNRFLSFIAALLSATVIFFFGVSLLAKFVGLNQAIALGIKPFVLTEMIKLLVVAYVTPKFWHIK